MLRHRGGQAGFSLVELLIGTAVGSIAVAGILSIFASTAGRQHTMIRSAHLQKELRGVMGVVTADLRRAGYSALLPGVDNDQDGTLDMDDLVFNPFLSGGNDITVGARAGEPAGSCVTYSYNLDEENPPAVGACTGCGALPADLTNPAPFSVSNLPYDANNMEMFGVRLNGGQVESRIGLAGTESDFDCDAGAWAPMTSDLIQVTALTFTLSHQQVEVDPADIADANDDCADGEPCQCIREVTLSLAGQLASDPFVRLALSETVRVRNDKFIASFDAAQPCRE
jgi:prepilin peptidase dependent protein B